MRILFLTHYFPPEVNAPASRTFEHCRVWARKGHAVDVVTNVPNHPAGRIYPGYRNALAQSESVSGIKVYRLFTFVAANRGVVKRTVNYLFYMVMACLAAPFLRRPDVVISTSPQFFCGLAGYFVSRIHRCRWVLEIRDLWPESIVAVGAMDQSLALRAVLGLVRFAYRRADHIVCVTDAFKAAIVQEGIPESRVSVIKNGVDLAFFSPDRELSSDARKPQELEGLKDKFVVAYVGTHGMAHGLDTILEAAEMLRDLPQIAFLMVGDGAEREALLRKRDMMRLDNVVMLEQQPKVRMPAIWSATAVSLVLLKDQPLFRTVIPSKIFESMGMMRPLVLGVRGESAELVTESGAGICIQPESAYQLARAVRELYHDQDLYQRLAASGRRFVEQHFDRNVLAERYMDVLSGVVAEKGQRSTETVNDS